MRKQGEHAQTIAIEKLVPFRSHPFVVRDDEQMQVLTDSIRSIGILTPAIARPLEDGTYELIPELLRMVDDGKIALTPAVELSYLKAAEQRLLLTTIDSEQATPSLSQAKRMKVMSSEGTLTDDAILQIMMERKKPDAWRLTLPMDKIETYFPRSHTPERMEETILRLLEIWQKQRKTNGKAKANSPSEFGGSGADAG